MKMIKRLSIDEILRISLFHSVLCQFEDGQYRIGRISYECCDGSVTPIYCPETLGELKYSGAKVLAYEDLISPTSILHGWHGPFTDEKEPKKNETCIVLIQEVKSYGERFKVTYACYDGISDFYGYKNAGNRRVIGFKHINKTTGKAY